MYCQYYQINEGYTHQIIQRILLLKTPSRDQSNVSVHYCLYIKWCQNKQQKSEKETKFITLTNNLSVVVSCINVNTAEFKIRKQGLDYLQFKVTRLFHSEMLPWIINSIYLLIINVWWHMKIQLIDLWKDIFLAFLAINERAMNESEQNPWIGSNRSATLLVCKRLSNRCYYVNIELDLHFGCCIICVGIILRRTKLKCIVLWNTI